mmetsp:Transcript_19000/g.73173  ORF Transcript_19000/g.73173 Transcript_19000/m.73173 type:complete len:213 (+) Transcript_19000:2184-2822(+)
MGSPKPLPSTKQRVASRMRSAMRLQGSRMLCSVMPMLVGSRCSASTSSDLRCLRSLLRWWENQSAMRESTVAWQVNAFVDATAFSLPAFRYTPHAVVLATSERTTFTTENVGTPRSSASINAEYTSAVSPLWEMTSRPAPSFGNMSRVSSEASTTVMLLKHCRAYIIFAPNLPAKRLVPHAAITRFVMPSIRSFLPSSPPSLAPSSPRIRPP